TATDVNKLLEINKFIQVERKKLKKLREMPTNEDCVILQILNKDSTTMYDISVEEVEEFVCNGLRVHNCFAHMSGSEGLRDVFRHGKDLYSQVAIDVNKLGHLY